MTTIVMLPDHRSQPGCLSAHYRVLERTVPPRTNRYLNNRVEQDHRGVNQRDDPLRSLGIFAAVARFGRAYDAPRNY
jgi:transposase-like protein